MGSRHVWSLKEKNINFEIGWKILERSGPYRKGSRRCDVCAAEKHLILLNTRGPDPYLTAKSEIFRNCVHFKKYLFRSWDPI